MTLDATAELAGHLERMKRDGFTIVEDVIDAEGATLERQPIEFERVLDSGTAFLVTSLLQGVVERGTGVEDLGDAGRQQHLLVLGGHDATDDDLDVGQPGGAQRVHQPGHDQVVGGQ